ncbi:MAG: histidine phosphatase family protein [Gammaproteobacteria bacterium]
MAWIALLRHGVTEWNELGLIQGRTDIPLSARGIGELRQVRPAAAFLSARWMCSPLRRAAQTAEILNPHARAEIDDALIEADWGEFEGIRRDSIESRIRELRITPRRGLDFAPPAGESPRMVQRRLLRWLEARAAARVNSVAVTHKGVIRSVLSAACDWDMREDFHRKADWTLPHVFCFARGALRLARLNCPWDEPPDDAI